jgi:hypothetical protein
MIEKQIVNVKGKGRMLVQYIRKNITLIGRGRTSPEVNSILTIEIDKNNLSTENGKIILREPYEESKLFDFGKHKEHYQTLNYYLNRFGV